MTKKIEFTNQAKKQIEKIIKEDRLKKFLRISVKGGGCFGFKYDFSFDSKTNEEDIVFDNAVIDRTEGFSGAELEQTVIEAMHLAFAERREIEETDLILAATQLVPLSRTAQEQLEALKQWASSGRARPASASLSKSLKTDLS